MSSEVVELLQALIRNACVSSGFPSTGEEERNVAVLASYLDVPGLDLEVVPLTAGRPALVARLEGSDPAADSLGLVAHTDVVPAGHGWSREPFGGELVRAADGTLEVWGRGAVDMLNQTAAMAVALKRLAGSGFRPAGDLVYVAVPDEECGGLVGMKALLEACPDHVRTAYALTEVGGAVRDTAAGPVVDVFAADKGAGAIRVVVRGRAGHASTPWGADNAVVKAAEVVRRIDRHRPPTRLHDTWREWVRAQPELHDETREALLDEEGLWDSLAHLPEELARTAHACTHTTMAPTVVTGGEKINTIPDTVELLVNVRPAFGEDLPGLVDGVRELLSGLVAPDDVTALLLTPATSSPTATRLWDVLEEVTRRHHEGARLVPAVNTAQTDARWLRPMGTTTYGFGVLDRRLSPSEYWSRFHGVDERIDVDSLDLSVRGWEGVATLFLSSS